jgi:hypothetical protein
MEFGYHPVDIRRRGYVTQRLLPVQKSLLPTCEWVCQLQMPKQEQEFNTAPTTLGPAHYLFTTCQGLFAQRLSCQSMRLSSCKAEVWNGIVLSARRQTLYSAKEEVTFVCLRKLRNAESVMSVVVELPWSGTLVHYVCFTTVGMTGLFRIVIGYRRCKKWSCTVRTLV